VDDPASLERAFAGAGSCPLDGDRGQANRAMHTFDGWLANNKQRIPVD
jgi:hypothetical protein